MSKYVVVIEQAEGNFSAYLPDIDGCVATGDTVEETLAVMKEALVSHLELMAEEGYPIPDPTTTVGYVEVEFPKPAARRAS